MTTLAITNIGLVASGDIRRPTLEADTVVIEDCLIAAVGAAEVLTIAEPDGEAESQYASTDTQGISQVATRDQGLH